MPREIFIRFATVSFASFSNLEESHRNQVFMLTFQKIVDTRYSWTVRGQAKIRNLRDLRFDKVGIESLPSGGGRGVPGGGQADFPLGRMVVAPSLAYHRKTFTEGTNSRIKEGSSGGRHEG